MTLYQERQEMEREMKRQEVPDTSPVDEKFIGVVTPLMTREILRDNKDQSQCNNRSIFHANIALSPIRLLPLLCWTALKRWSLTVTR